MNKWQKETEIILLNHEKKVLNELLINYARATKDVSNKIKELEDAIEKLIEQEPDNETLLRSKIYQLKYQKELQKNIDITMEQLKKSNVNSITDFLMNMYEDGYLSQIYNLQHAGIPVILPINQELLIKALMKDTAEMIFSQRIYVNVEQAKKEVIAEISRGISTGMPYSDVARNVSNRLQISFRKAYRTVRTEGGRVSTDAKLDSMRGARDKGADIVKVWSATLDMKTRPVHQELDHKWAEIDEPFKCSLGKVQAPFKFGDPAEDINCRCSLLSMPRWDIDTTYRRMDNITKDLVDVANYQEWKELYYTDLEKE